MSTEPAAAPAARGRKRLLVIVAAAVAVVAAGLLAIAWRLHSLDEETVRREIAARLEAALGTKVEVRRAELSVLSGLRLEGLTVAEPPPLRGRLLAAEAFVLRYRPWPLLLGRVEIDRLALVRPSLDLRADRRGVFNYERLAPPRSGAAPAAALPLRVRLRKVSVERGSVSVTDASGSSLARLEDVTFGAAVEVGGGLATGKGDARVATLALGDRLFLRDATAPLRLGRDQVVLAPIRARLAGGRASGDATVRLAGGFHWVVNLSVEDASVETMLAEAKATKGLAGRLHGRARFEGASGLATVRGQGDAEVRSCRLAGSRALALVGGVLGLPELERPEFDECRMAFTQRGARITMPSLALKGPTLEVRGHGSMLLDSGALDYDLTLALAPALFARLTRPELRPAFRTRKDGFAEVDFRLTGTTVEPRTDLAARIAGKAASHALTDQVSRWLGLKKKER